MNDRELLEKKIDEIFKDKNIDFQKINYDEDLNYYISVDGSEIISGIGNLEILMFFSDGYPKCTLMMGNIYRFKSGEDALAIANRINSKLNSGRVVVYDTPKQLVYLNSKVLDDYNNMDEKVITGILKELYVAIAVIYTDIKVLRDEE